MLVSTLYGRVCDSIENRKNGEISKERKSCLNNEINDVHTLPRAVKIKKMFKKYNETSDLHTPVHCLQHRCAQSWILQVLLHLINLELHSQ